MSQDTVLVYTDRILSGSATFIRAQTEHVESFSTVYVGTKRVPDGLDVAAHQRIVLNEGTLLGRVREALFKVTGAAPVWKRQLRRQGARLIHAHFAPDGLMALPIARYLDVPLIVTFQGYGITTDREHAKKSFYRHRKYVRNKNKLFRKADKFIAVSEYIKKKALKKGCREEKIDVLYTGTDTEIFKPDRIGDRQPIVLFVGRIVEKKGLRYLIRAMEIVQRKIEKKVKMLVVGDGEMREDMEDEASRRIEHAEFIGFQPLKIVRKWMNRAMLLAVPSVTAESGDSEGLPNVVFEGQAMGLPVVGSDHAGIPEALVHGETGFLFPEGDWKTLAKYIIRIMENKKMRENFGHKARKRIKRNFSIRKQSKKLEKIYESHID